MECTLHYVALASLVRKYTPGLRKEKMATKPTVSVDELRQKKAGKSRNRSRQRLAVGLVDI